MKKTEEKISDGDLLKAALRDLDVANKVLRAVIQAARWEDKQRLLEMCDDGEKHLGGPVKKPLPGSSGAS